VHENVANRNQGKYTSSHECTKRSKIKLYEEEEEQELEQEEEKKKKKKKMQYEVHKLEEVNDGSTIRTCVNL
jgi:hypothetical protein